MDSTLSERRAGKIAGAVIGLLFPCVFIVIESIFHGFLAYVNGFTVSDSARLHLSLRTGYALVGLGLVGFSVVFAAIGGAFGYVFSRFVDGELGPHVYLRSLGFGLLLYFVCIVIPRSVVGGPVANLPLTTLLAFVIESLAFAVLYVRFARRNSNIIEKTSV